MTPELAEIGWRALEQDIGLTVSNYGTVRVLARDRFARFDVVAHVSPQPGVRDTRESIPIEMLPKTFTERYRSQGAEFYTAEEIAESPILRCVEEAFCILGRVPTLVETVTRLVRSLHLLQPPDDVHDVSFSEPNLPFSVFVSVPVARVANDALRVAEAILHEAMHLQLTLIEALNPLVLSSNAKYYSPWKHERRSVGGILHALYVFFVIRQFFSAIRSILAPTDEFFEHATSRQSEIASQMSEVQNFRVCSSLRSVGATFVSELLREDTSKRHPTDEQGSEAFDLSSLFCH